MPVVFFRIQIRENDWYWKITHVLSFLLWVLGSFLCEISCVLYTDWCACLNTQIMFCAGQHAKCASLFHTLAFQGGSCKKSEVSAIEHRDIRNLHKFEEIVVLNFVCNFLMLVMLLVIACVARGLVVLVPLLNCCGVSLCPCNV